MPQYLEIKTIRLCILVGLIAGCSQPTPPKPPASSLAQVQPAGGDDALPGDTGAKPDDGTNTTLPTVSITSPGNGTTVKGTVNMAAEVGGQQPADVVFLIDQNLVATLTQPPYQYDWDTTAVANGSHVLEVQARDSAGNATTSEVSVSVDNAGGPAMDQTAPVLAIMSPAAGQGVQGTVKVVIDASDDDQVASVVLQIDGSTAQTFFAPPYEFDWNTQTVSNGTHALKGVAMDRASNKGQAELSVTVNNQIPDTKPPTISITAPANGDSVMNTVVVSVTATDDVSIAQIEFFIDGALKYTDTNLPYSYNWSTTTVANGSRVIKVVATDPSNNPGEAVVSVTVNNPVPDTTPPVVTISSPAAAATVSGTVQVTATASDSSGVSNVQFHVDGVLKATDTTVPYSYSWNTATYTNAAYTLRVVANDSAGNSGEKQISVTVSNAPATETTPPTLTVSYPNSGQTLDGRVYIVANASDASGIASVEFYIDNVLTFTDNTIPYARIWDATTVTNGSHTIKIEAFDLNDNMATGSRSITVNNKALTIMYPPANYPLAANTTINLQWKNSATGGTKFYYCFHVDGETDFWRDCDDVATSVTSKFVVIPNSPGKKAAFFVGYMNGGTYIITDTVDYNIQ